MQTTLKPIAISSIASLDDPFWAVWRKVRPLVVKALVRSDEYGVEDVLRYVSEGRWMLWHGDRCVAFTKVSRYAKHTACVVILCGGDLDEIQKLEPDMAKWAKQQGCKYLVIHGRRGGGRALDGYREKSTSYRKAL